MKVLGSHTLAPLVFAGLCVVTAGCKNNEDPRCFMKTGPAPEGALATIVDDLPMGDGKVCGVFEIPGIGGKHPVLRIDHTEHGQALADRYFETLREAGWTESDDYYPPGGINRAFEKGDVRFGVSVVTSTVEIEDLSHHLAQRREREATAAARETSHEAALTRIIAALSTWVPTAGPLVEATIGTPARECEPGLALPPGVRVFDWHALEALARGEREVLRLDGEFKAWPCEPLARISGFASQECPEQTLTDTGPLVVLAWHPSDARAPKLVADVSSKGDGSFDAGYLRGQLVVWDRDAGAVACHAPVSARSSAKFDVNIVLNEDGTSKYDTMSEIKLNTDFSAKVDEAVASALATISP